MDCPTCQGKAEQTESYKGNPIYTCADCKNRFGFIEIQEKGGWYDATILRTGS